ncbi:MAG: hypothetical protein HY270_02170 [Deltaproteobacteria bacterium]|nr:hypothetical protein [Deltaproteobacteria bacterium]
MGEVDTPVPTVPPATPTPPPTPAPLATRPVLKKGKADKGEFIGPVITHLGAARADGLPVEPVSNEGGIPTYMSAAGSGFIIVIEAKPGSGGGEVARRVFAYQAGDPKVRPDLEIISSRDLGNGSPKVCDRMRPDIGGIPAVNPTRFDETQKISDAINDFSCRFETFNESQSSCTSTKTGDFSFVKQDTTQQFCMMVAHAWSFTEGDTILTVRVRDMNGNPGPAKKMRVRHPPASKVTKKPTPVPTPSKPKGIPTRGAD